MGRPKSREPRIRQLNLSLTESELASIEQRAQAVGMRPVNFSRSLLIDPSRNLPRPQDNAIERLIYSQLARIGNNLNQLLRHLHFTGDPIPPDLEPLLTEIRQIIARGPK